MAADKRHREITWLRNVLVSAGFVVAGVLLIRLSVSLKNWGFPSWEPVASNVGGLLIAAVGLSLIWELISKRSFANEIMAIARVSEDVRGAGLMGITTDFYKNVDWAELLKNPRDVEIMVAYAGTWVSPHLNQLRKLSEHGTSHIRLILPDPDDASVMDEMARRFNQSPETLKGKIQETIELIKELFYRETPEKNRLELWYIKKALLYTYYKFDDTYIMTTYFKFREFDDGLRATRRGEFPPVNDAAAA